MRYIDDTYEAASDTMRYDSAPLRCSAIRFRFDSTQCDSMQYDAMEKYDHFYFFGSDRQQIIN